MYRVILVDDEPWALLGIKNCYLWHQNGYQVIFETTDPFDAYDRIKSEKPDVVFTDIKMYGMSGLELVRKAVEIGIDAEFVIVSGYNEFNYAKEAIEYGVFHYLLKPIEKHEVYLMMEKLTKHLDKKTEMRKISAASTVQIRNTSVSDCQPNEEKSTFENILRYVNANYTDDISLNFLSQKFYLHNTYISGLFKKNLGITFSEYLTDLRLKKASSLLMASDYPVNEVAAMSGYRDYNYFTRVFREHFNMTPVQYRRSNCQKQD